MARKLGRPRESWLRSEDHEKFAEAMVTCRSPEAACGQRGWCKYGDCFTAYKKTDSEKIGFLEQKLRELEAVIDELRRGNGSQS